MRRNSQVAFIPLLYSSIVSKRYCLFLSSIVSLELYAHSTKKGIESEGYNEYWIFVRKLEKKTTFQT